ncbi:DUF5793 family protein [Halapricum salinum]|uniref:Uncharacterized protein n=1 Tax=Halapricum salinum TaxID=1457250 RepID=A0A4D6H9E8_9EURY|nr:DUF5793 family protein [Halapricum salinum]QCC50573.1 hypothetical protein DV733_04635 [Halapricum salinum]
MRREDFRTDVDVDEPEPELTVTFEGTPQVLRERFDGDDPLDAEDIDVAYRETPTDEPGVLSVTDRVTGEYIFEAPLEDSALRDLVETAAARDEDERDYHLRIDPGDGQDFVFEKSTLLVYDIDGNLDRDRSLIPGGVEL